MEIKAAKIIADNREDLRTRIIEALKQAYDEGRDSVSLINENDIRDFRVVMRELQHESKIAEFCGESWNRVEEKFLMAAFANFLAKTAARHGRTVVSIAARYKDLRKRGWNPWHT